MLKTFTAAPLNVLLSLLLRSPQVTSLIKMKHRENPISKGLEVHPTDDSM